MDNAKESNTKRPDISAVAECFLSKTIKDIDCSTRMRNALRARDIDNMLELVLQEESNFIYLSGSGKKTIQEIKSMLKDNDLSLEMKFSNKEILYLKSLTK